MASSAKTPTPKAPVKKPAAKKPPLTPKKPPTGRRTGKKTLMSLEHRHHAAARMKVAGRNNKYIANYLGVSEVTLRDWWQDPLITAEIEKYAVEIKDKFSDRLVESATAALSALEEMLQMPVDGGTISASEKRKAASELLDRLPQTSTNADRNGANVQPSESQIQLLQVFSGQSDEELMATLRDTANQLSEQGVIDAQPAA